MIELDSIQTKQCKLKTKRDVEELLETNMELSQDLGGFLKHIRKCSIVVTQLWGVYEGLILVYGKGKLNYILIVRKYMEHTVENYKTGAGMGT